MRRRTLIRTTLFLGSVCVSIWQLPQMLERFDSILGGHGIALPTAVRASDLPEGTIIERAKPQNIVVFSPDGKTLTPEQAEALRKQAAAIAPINKVADAKPKPADPATPDPSKVEIGAPNPAVEELLKQLNGEKDANKKP